MLAPCDCRLGVPRYDSATRLARTSSYDPVPGLCCRLEPSLHAVKLLLETDVPQNLSPYATPPDTFKAAETIGCWSSGKLRVREIIRPCGADLAVKTTFSVSELLI